MITLGLYAITDERFHPGRTMLEVMEEAIAGGVRVIQLRDKKATKKELFEKAKALRELCASFGVTFLINDHVDVAQAVDADGVHLGQDDLPLQEARRLLGENKLIGISTHSLKQALAAEEGGADYVGVGPIFPTKTKEDVTEPVTLSLVKEARKHLRIPFTAIGGIKLHNVDEVLQAGARSVCAVSEIVGSQDVRATCEAFLRKMEKAGALD